MKKVLLQGIFIDSSTGMTRFLLRIFSKLAIISTIPDSPHSTIRHLKRGTYTLQVHTASNRLGYTLPVHTARGGNGYTLHVHCWQWKRIYLHVHSAGSGKRYNLHVHTVGGG
jgi:hypothetical protein